MANFQNPFLAAMSHLGLLPQRLPLNLGPPQFQFANLSSPIQPPSTYVAPPSGSPQPSQGQGSSTTPAPSFPDANLAALVALLAKAALPDAPHRPIGQQPIDDKVLIAALHTGQSRGYSALQTLNDLHGANNHTAEQWKAYYIVNYQRVDQELLILKNARQAQNLAEPPESEGDDSSKGPDGRRDHVDERKQEQGDESESSGGEYHKTTHHPLHRRQRYQDIPKQRPRTRFTSYGKQSRLPSRYRDDVASSPPVHSKRPTQVPQTSTIALSLPPTPTSPPPAPTTVIPVSRGAKNIKFSQEDKEFFVNLILWETHINPSATRTGIVEKLADMAPHHSVQSWNTWWKRKGQGQDIHCEALRRRRAASRTTSPESSILSSP
ncbi:hypothetical protein OF83DRAFT_1169849 [Amylostereum chailletii]|nr:hypothetical protein OF83DRAFT_1169849 [Amylostereum chailletii]